MSADTIDWEPIAPIITTYVTSLRLTDELREALDAARKAYLDAEEALEEARADLNETFAPLFGKHGTRFSFQIGDASLFSIQKNMDGGTTINVSPLIRLPFPQATSEAITRRVATTPPEEATA